MTLQQIVNELVQLGVEPTMTKSGWKLPGFYKHGEVLLKEKKDYFVIVDRYNVEHHVNCTYDVIYFNYKCWLDYKSDWPQPNDDWTEAMLLFKLIKKETIEVYSPNDQF